MKTRPTPRLLAALAIVGIVALESPHSVVRAAPERHDEQQPVTQADASRSVVRGGVYSEEQAKRGESVYLDECARCHSDALLGTDGGPPLVGQAFMSGWNEKSVGDLFELVRTKMPYDSPGRLTRQQTSDILAYLLQANSFPPGEKALETDLSALNTIKIQSATPADR